jgi:hypothetical protein
MLLSMLSALALLSAVVEMQAMPTIVTNRTIDDHGLSFPARLVGRDGTAQGSESVTFSLDSSHWVIDVNIAGQTLPLLLDTSAVQT